MSKFLDENGLLYLWTRLKGMFAAKVDKVEGITNAEIDSIMSEV